MPDRPPRPDLPSLPWDRAHVFAHAQPATADHCDAFDHVNNAVYVAWQDQIAWAHSTALGWPIDKIVQLGVGWVVQENRCTYEAPVTLGQTLALGTWILTNDQRLRCVRAFQFIDLAAHKTVFRGQITYVTFDLRKQRVTRMPDQLRQTFQPSARNQGSNASG